MVRLIYNFVHQAGIAQLAERKLPKLEVAGSTPVARSISSLQLSAPCYNYRETYTALL